MRPIEQLEKIEEFTAGKDRLITDLKLNRFQLLVAVLLSSRTREEKTLEAVKKLKREIKKPEDALKLGKEKIREMIRGVAFHNEKAKRIVELSRILTSKHRGRVPSTLEGLVKLPGVGRKTANLVLSAGFSKPAICVDTHVHRISNRLGWVRTKTPAETEKELMKLFPEEKWKSINRALVVFGRSVCLPRFPRCSECPIKSSCMYFLSGGRNGVERMEA